MKNWNQIAENLQPYYADFKVSERVLLTGHSHQAWPNSAREGQLQAYEDAAQWVDDKWAKAFDVAEQLRTGILSTLDDSTGDITFGSNTQELLVRWLSALPLDAKPKLVTTDGEFHSMRRLLDRLSETPVQIVKVAAQPAETLAARLLAATDGNTAAVMCSMVMFKTGDVVPGMTGLAAQLRAQGVPLLLDAYHLFNIVPFSVDEAKLQDVFIVGGGYKYAQWGEGNCFLRVPSDCDWRPLVTGWYAEFAQLNQTPGEKVSFGKGRWAFEGSTYDPTSHYRALAVMRFFEAQQLTVAQLRAVNMAQQQCLLDALKSYDWPSDVELPEPPSDQRGGFMVIRTDRASEAVAAMRQKHVFLDSRGDCLRLGPAPYVTEKQLQYAAKSLHEFFRAESTSTT